MIRMLAVLLAILPASAQQNTPHVGYVYPAGGRQGDTLEVIVGGQYLNGVSEAFLSGPGVQASVIEYVKPMSQGEFNQLREQLQELNEKRTAKKQWTPADEKTAAAIRLKLANFVRRPVAPAIVETVRVQIRMARDAAPGARELRLGASLGLTNPLVFCIDSLPEFSRCPARAVDEAAVTARVARYRDQATFNKPDGPMKITLPAIVNGQIMPGIIDKFQFQASKGQRLVVAASARELIPYISDAVPGWFQAALALSDAKGNELDYAEHYLFHPDPVLYYQIPADGEYTLAVKDSIYRGREDFVYRIRIGELPYLTGIFPLGGKIGARTTLALSGWNLPSAKLPQNTKNKPAGVYPVSVRQGDQTSNALPFALNTLPERLESEPNNTIRNAQKVKLPVVINGRIDRPGDWDVFRIDARAGEEIVAEVTARRLDSPLDSILRLTDAAGKELAVNDDSEDKGSGLLTHHADSLLRLKLPAKGAYYIHFGDAQRQGGPQYAYRLRLSHPRPDYELRVVPSSLNARAGTSVPVTVYALRRDGFSGEIALKLKDAPPGFLLSGAWVPAGEDKVRLTLTVSAAAFAKPLDLHLEGYARIEGKEVRRPGVPAEDMMQAFAYRHLVVARQWMVRVSGQARLRTAWKASDRVKLPAGGTAPVQVFVPPGRLPREVQLALNEPPEGIAIQNVSPVKDGLSVTLRADASKVRPGTKGNLILDAYVERATAATASAKAGKRKQPLGTLPAIPFEVVPETRP